VSEGAGADVAADLAASRAGVYAVSEPRGGRAVPAAGGGCGANGACRGYGDEEGGACIGAGWRGCCEMIGLRMVGMVF